MLERLLQPDGRVVWVRGFSLGRVRELGRCPVLVERLGTCLWLKAGGGFSSNLMRGPEIGGLSARRLRPAGRGGRARGVSSDPVRELGRRAGPFSGAVWCGRLAGLNGSRWAWCEG